MIQVKNLSYGYNKRRLVLEGINLTLPVGHIYGLLGKNGVGKSTLLKLMAGTLRGEGECTIDGTPSADRPVKLLERLRLLPENETIPELTIQQMSMVMEGLYPTFSRERLFSALRAFELEDDAVLSRLSMGGQKKAMVSMAIACGTEYLLLDEPTNGMDIPSKAVFRRLIADAVADPDCKTHTVVISTHQVDDLENLIDAVTIMSDRGILLSDTLEEIGKRFCFGKADEGDEVLYSEPSIHGDKCMMRNTSGIEMPVDVKLLFSGIVNGID